MKNIILASNSPRRQELLANIGIKYQVKVLEVEESYPNETPLIEVAEYLAIKKNKAYQPDFDQEIIITADTVVINKDQILGKPVDFEDAKRMLLAMSGQKHWVISAVCISSKEQTVSFSDVVEVDMIDLTNDEIDYYIDQYKPFDKAGGYGIQEWIGMIGIRKITGSFYTVMGLPIHKVYRSLKNDFGIDPIKI